MLRSFTSLVIFHLVTSIGIEEDSNFRSVDNLNLVSDLMDSFKKFTYTLQTLFKTPMEKIGDKATSIRRFFDKMKLQNEPASRFVTSTKATTTYLTNEIHIPVDDPEDLITGEDNTPIDIVTANGYNLQSHYVYTVDGYVLTLHRVVPKAADPHTGKVVLLHHGLFGSSCDWLLLGKKSLPYILVESGYDVWLANARGNKYSRGHVSRAPDSREYWNFSWQEIGVYDLSAVISYMRTVTEGSALIDYVGHCMGGTALLAFLSSFPQYNLVMKCAVLLGPLGFMYNVKGPMRFLADIYRSRGENSLSFLGDTSVFKNNTFPPSVIRKYCTGEQLLCQNPWLFLANGGQPIKDPEMKARVLEHVPSGGSFKTIIHYLQLIYSGQLSMYDLGIMNNTRKYGTTMPPTLRLNDINVPIAFITANNDWLAPREDIKTLLSHISTTIIHHFIGKDDFSHTDYLWSPEAPKHIYLTILDIFERKGPA